MGGVRSVLIKFLGDSTGLKQATQDADGKARTFGDRIEALGKRIGAADGASGKLKAGLSGLKDIMGSGAAQAAVATAGVAALGAAAVKSVTAFEDTAVAVGKFRDATGTTSEEASRFVEVFNDLGIGADAGATAIGRMEKTLGANAHAFDQYGVAVVRAKDGTIDAQATFVNAVDALNKIQDPAQRAAAGAAMFGKGWQSMAEVIGSGAPALQKALESVQPSKIFTDADVQSGRDVRDAFDQLKDAGEGLMLTLGKALAPVVSELAPILSDVVTAAGPAVEAIGHLLADAFRLLGPIIETTVKIIGPLIDALGKVIDVVDGAARKVHEFFTDMPDGSIAQGAFDKVRQGAGDAGDALKNQSEWAKRQGQAARDSAEANKKAAEELQKQADAAAKAEQAQRDLLDAEMSAVDTTFRVADAKDRLAEAAASYRSADQQTPQLLRDVAKAAWDSAQAALADASARAEMAGSTLSAAQQQEILRTSLQQSAAAMGPGSPMGAAITDLLANLDSLNAPTTVDVSAPGAGQAATDVQGVADAQGNVKPKTTTTTEVQNQATSVALLAAIATLQANINKTKVVVTPQVNAADAIRQASTLLSLLNEIPTAAQRASSSAVSATQSAQQAINRIRAGSSLPGRIGGP